MKIKSLHIQNYKSLRDFKIYPDDLTVLIGANGSGKSNFASALDFLADIYESGLEYAVAKKGGYENIALRKIRRSKAPIFFEIEVEFNGAGTRRAHPYYIFQNDSKIKYETITVRHAFSIRAARQAIRTDYTIESEVIEYTAESKQDADSNKHLLIDIKGKKQKITSNDSEAEARLEDYMRLFSTSADESDGHAVELDFPRLIGQVAKMLGSISVFQFSAQIARAPGAPSPYPKLDSYGQNLPSLIDWLRRNHPKKWASIENAMRDIVPNLEEITTDYLHSKTLGIFFKEEGFGRPWNAEDVSDGTIQALSILTALADPRNDVVMIEEPENSLHPWIVKSLSKNIQALSKSNQLILTTHSPIILNLVTPEQVWVLYRENGATEVSRISDLYPEAIKEWKEGSNRLYDIIDFGLIPKALPQGYN